jgi:hypothetical protein
MTIALFNMLLLQSEAGWEEFFDYIFPEDEEAKPNLKLLAMAKAWKRKQEELPSSSQQVDMVRILMCLKLPILLLIYCFQILNVNPVSSFALFYLIQN